METHRAGKKVRKILEKLFRENKTSPPLKTPQKDFQLSHFSFEFRKILSLHGLEPWMAANRVYDEKVLTTELRRFFKTLSNVNFVMIRLRSVLSTIK